MAPSPFEKEKKGMSENKIMDFVILKIFPIVLGVLVLELTVLLSYFMIQLIKGYPTCGH